MMNNKLHDICSRIATIERQKKELADEASAIKKDAKAEGFDTSLITKTVRIMNLEAEKQKKALDQHELFDSYLEAAGLLKGGE